MEACLLSMRRTLRLRGLNLHARGDFIRDHPDGPVSRLGSNIQLVAHATNPFGTKRGNPLFVTWDYMQGPLMSEAEMGIFLAGMAASDWERQQCESEPEPEPRRLTFVRDINDSGDPFWTCPDLGGIVVARAAYARPRRCALCDSSPSLNLDADLERHLLDDHRLQKPSPSAVEPNNLRLEQGDWSDAVQGCPLRCLDHGNMVVGYMNASANYECALCCAAGKIAVLDNPGAFKAHLSSFHGLHPKGGKES